jgi:DNA-binding cell septation regulator SpoVG
MPAIIYGIRLFVMSLGGANTAQSLLSWRYHTHPHIFSGWYCIFIYSALLFLAWPYSNLLVGVMIIEWLVYVSCIYILNRAGWFNVMFKVDSLPAAFKDVAHPIVTTAIVKVLEVILQDMIAIVIAQGLLQYTGSLLMSSLIFTTIVFLVHVPSIWLYGVWYGTYFLLLASILASSVVFLVAYSATGFVIIVGIHLVCYLALYLLSGFLARVTATTLKL